MSESPMPDPRPITQWFRCGEDHSFSQAMQMPMKLTEWCAQLNALTCPHCGSSEIFLDRGGRAEAPDEEADAAGDAA